MHFNLNDLMSGFFIRCLFTTVNPETGQRDGSEPVATLRRYGAYFNRFMKCSLGYGSRPLRRIGGEAERKAALYAIIQVLWIRVFLVVQVCRSIQYIYVLLYILRANV